MTDLAIDYAWTHPDPNNIPGYIGVLRYLSSDASKSISADEAAALGRAGKLLGLVWENGAQDALGGAAAGARDGQTANQHADAVGFPRSLPLYYAADFDVQPNQMQTCVEYVQAAGQQGRAARGYGSIAFIEGLALAGISPGWQAEAWSGTAVSPHACLYQRVQHTIPTLPGVDPGAYDENVIIDLANAGLWDQSVSAAAASPPVIIPAPPPAPQAQEEPVPPTIRLGAKGQVTGNLQGLLNANGRPTKIDYDFGPITTGILAQWQQAAGLVPDGIAGPKTWHVLLGW
jgi:hypothetical protein